jgi:hypothetical protein
MLGLLVPAVILIVAGLLYLRRYPVIA